MSAVADHAVQQSQDEQNPVDGMLDEVVRRFLDAGGEISARDEAVRIIEWLERREPDLLVDWFRDHMVQFLGQQLQVRLACARRSSRRPESVFADDDTEPREPVLSAYSRPYACPEGKWKPLGDMLRSDWEHVCEDRASRAAASLFEVGFARRVMAKLPDDTTLTREVLSEAEIEHLEKLERTRVSRTIQKFAA